MDRQSKGVSRNRRTLIDRFADQVEYASKRNIADRNRNWSAGIYRLHASYEAVGCAQGYASDEVVAKVLRGFESKRDIPFCVANGDRVVDFG
jgi:hypothetical protein